MDLAAYNAAAQRGYLAAVGYLAGLAPRFPDWTTDELATVHFLYFGELYPHAGQWRKAGELASFGPLVGADWMHVEPEMRLLLDQLGELNAALPCYQAGVLPTEVLTLVAFMHARLIFTHPFNDGNGRWARLITSVVELQLVSEDHLPLLEPLPKPVYIHALGCAPKNIVPLVSYYAEHRGLRLSSLAERAPPFKVQVTHR